MWIADLSPYGTSERIVAARRRHEYPRGDVPLDVFQTLRELLVDPWEPASSIGLHPCDLCLHEPEKCGSENLFVPGEQRVYVAPELILHCLNVHGYRPPDVVCDAVRSCPAP